MNRLRTSACPTLEDLLLAQEDELPPEPQATVSSHLRRCPACQSKLAAAASTLFLVGQVATQFEHGNREDAAEARMRPFLVRLHARKQQRIHRQAGWPIRRWLPMAAVMPIVIFAFLLSESHSVVIQADELVQHATRVELARPAGSAQRLHLTLTRPQAIAIAGMGVPSFSAEQETTDGMVLATAAAAPDGTPATLAYVLAQHRFNWRRPLSVVCFNAWRAGLASKHDQVTAARESPLLVLRTTTHDDGDLREVQLIVERDTYRVVREVFVFETLGTLEIEARAQWVRQAAPVAVAPVATSASALPERRLPDRTGPLVLAQPVAQPDMSRWLDRRFGNTAMRATFLPELRQLTASVAQRFDDLQDLSGRYLGSAGPQSSPVARARFERERDRQYRSVLVELDTLRERIQGLVVHNTPRWLSDRSAMQETAPADWSRRVDAGLRYASTLDRLMSELRAYDDLPPALQRQLTDTFDALWSAIYGPSPSSVR